MTTSNERKNFEIAKVGRSVLYTIYENHGDEGYKYALSLFQKIEENNAVIDERKEENDSLYGVLQRLTLPFLNRGSDTEQ